MALWILAFLSVLAIGVAARAQTQLHAALILSGRVQMTQAAWASVEEAVAFLKERQKEGKPFLEMKREKFEIFDERGKLSLNKASVQTLSALLAQVELPPPASVEEIAQAIVDWRGNSPFESAEELLLIKGVDYASFLKIKDFVTVFGDGKVNLNTAPKPVLKALGTSDALMDRVVEYRKGPDGSSGTEDDRIFTSVAAFPSELSHAIGLTDELLAEASASSNSGLFTVGSELFRLVGYGRLVSRPGIQRQIRCVVELATGRVLEWHED
ncbi:MAG: general secretion pathway protein GspK [Candidatus Omnitrophica bacterium]|nr:general secretion pathway protein GspK [Candidatus Omnitrophota bacterium]